MADLYGADIEALRDLGRAFDDVGEQLATARTVVASHVDSVGWWGPNGEQFRDEWSGRHVPSLVAAVAELTRAGEVVRRNADDQERASGTLDGGGSGGPVGPGVRPHGGDHSGEDLPGNPDIGDFGTYIEAEDISLDDEALDPSMLNQSAIGDCWLLAGLGAVAHDNPGFFREHMVENDDGTWTVTMYKDGDPVEITVEPEVPSDGVMDPSGDPSWASIYEKAAAEYWGGDYDNLVGGYSDEAFEAITGMEADRSGEGSLEDVRDALQDGPVAAGTEDEDSFWWWEEEVDDDRIVPNHAYVIDEVRENDAGELEVHVINPWGPGSGVEHGSHWLTEQEWDENFDTLYTTPSTR